MMTLDQLAQSAPSPIFVFLGIILFLLSFGVHIGSVKIDRVNYPNSPIYARLFGALSLVVGILFYQPTQMFLIQLSGNDSQILRENISKLNSELEKANADIVALNARLQASLSSSGDQVKRVAESEEQIAKLARELQRKERELSELKIQHQRSEKAISELTVRLELSRNEVTVLTSEKSKETKTINELKEKLIQSDQAIEKLISELKAKNKEFPLPKKEKDVDATGKDKKEKAVLSEEDRIRHLRHSRFQIILVFSYVTSEKTKKTIATTLESEGFRVTRRQFLSGIDKVIRNDPELTMLWIMHLESGTFRIALEKEGISVPDDPTLNDMLNNLSNGYSLTDSIIEENQSAAIVHRSETAKIAKKIQEILSPYFWQLPLVEHEGLTTPSSFDKDAEVPIGQRILIYFLLR